ncbi:MAG: metal-sensitive transcriptional regulator [Candidatus Campbellbacteria bacterium]|nr:metal-sensitive transcriptional regulator [Candidatus Campbellbacteria bacterium]
MHTHIHKNVENRLKRIEGQVRGLQKMVVEGKYCIDVITQSSAIRNALASVEDLMLQNHLTQHVVHQMKHGKETKAAQEILKVYKLKRK